MMRSICVAGFGLVLGVAAVAQAEDKPAAEPVKAEAPNKAEPAKGAEMITTPSGLKYQDLKTGEGPQPKAGDRVAVHYTGTLENGSKFDSSLDRGRPFEFLLGRGAVIKGWDEGVATMKVGGKRKLVIPPALGYGNQNVGNGLIPPNSVLIFDVELLEIKP